MAITSMTIAMHAFEGEKNIEKTKWISSSAAPSNHWRVWMMCCYCQCNAQLFLTIFSLFCTIRRSSPFCWFAYFRYVLNFVASSRTIVSRTDSIFQIKVNSIQSHCLLNTWYLLTIIIKLKQTVKTTFNLRFVIRSLHFSRFLRRHFFVVVHFIYAICLFFG